MNRLLDQWVFSTPWWLPTLVVAVGIGLWVSGNKRTDKTLKRVGLLGVLLGVALGLVSYLVETRVERVTRQSRELVRTVVDRDWKKMQSLLDPKVTLKVQGVPFGLQYGDRDAILKGAREGVERIGLSSGNVTHVEVQDADQADVLEGLVRPLVPAEPQADAGGDDDGGEPPGGAEDPLIEHAVHGCGSSFRGGGSDKRSRGTAPPIA